MEVKKCEAKRLSSQSIMYKDSRERSGFGFDSFYYFSLLSLYFNYFLIICFVWFICTCYVTANTNFGIFFWPTIYD